MFMSFSRNKFTLLQQNSVTDVSVGFRPPCWSSSRWAPAWRLHTNLYIKDWVKHFFGYLVYEIFLWPESWRGSLYMYLPSFTRIWTLSIEGSWFLFWSILNGVTLKTSNCLHFPPFRLASLWTEMISAFSAVSVLKSRSDRLKGNATDLNVLQGSCCKMFILVETVFVVHFRVHPFARLHWRNAGHIFCSIDLAQFSRRLQNKSQRAVLHPLYHAVHRGREQSFPLGRNQRWR